MRIVIVRVVDGWAAHATAVLRAAGYRSGGARAAVVDFLGREECCVSAQQVHEGIRRDGRAVGVASVYRVLDLLLALGLVQRVDVGGDVAMYEAVHPDGAHHHHLVCGDCGRVERFTDDGLERALHGLGERVGYAVAGHDVTLRGACGDCRPTAAPP
ncbi:MAG: transcriptional repressor [Thermoleophilia bacterium]|nr:transcriptional repressor [Thermoleophilia bacterium]